VGADIWYELAGLIDLGIVRISARVSGRQVLNGIDATSILHVIVRVVQYVKCLYLQREVLPLCELKATTEANVNLLRPRPIERVQPRDRVWRPRH
jgi:hypothetical protein